MPCVEHPVDPPVRRDGGEGLQYEAATRNLIMRDGEAARAPLPAAPQDKVKVEHARAPALAHAAPEPAFQQLHPPQHFRRFEVALHHCDCVREIAARAAVRRVEDDGRGIEQTEIVVQLGNCLLYTSDAADD